MLRGECAVLVVSCDAYADLWVPFLTLFRRHWADCPFPVYLGAGASPSPADFVSLLRSNGGRDWSRCLRDYLDQIPEARVLMMLDDFFLRAPVDTTRVLHCLQFSRARAAAQMRLVARPRPTDPVPGERIIGESAPGSPYRLSTQAAIWDRRALQAVLRDGESIWEFEHNGNARACAMPTGFFSVWRSVLPYEGLLAHHVIEKGRWLPHEKMLFASRGIGCDFRRRPTLGLGPTLLYQAAMAFHRVVAPLPWRLRARVVRGVKRLLRPLAGRTLDRMAGKTNGAPGRPSVP